MNIAGYYQARIATLKLPPKIAKTDAGNIMAGLMKRSIAGMNLDRKTATTSPEKKLEH